MFKKSLAAPWSPEGQRLSRVRLGRCERAPPGLDLGVGIWAGGTLGAVTLVSPRQRRSFGVDPLSL